MGKVIRKTTAEIGQGGRIDYARVDATTQADIERQAREDGTDLREFPPSPASIRKGLGMTQREIAGLLGMPLATWRNWEQGRTEIDAPGRALLVVLAKEPGAVRRALEKAA
jgi:putative transcriptional regulator